MKPRSSKAKGRLLQQWVRHQILMAFPELEEGDVKSTTMGEAGTDIQLSPKALQVFPFAVECKKYSKFSVYDHFEQAQNHIKQMLKGLKTDKRPHISPLVIIEGDYKKPLAIIDAELFMALQSVAIFCLQEMMEVSDSDPEAQP